MRRGIFRTVATGTVSQANMKISAVDGTAFVDFSNSETIKLVNKIGHLLRIKDSAGRQIQGFIEAAGSGETYNEYVDGDNSTFASDTGFWTKQDNWSIGSGVATRVAGVTVGSIYRTIVLTVGSLIRAQADFAVTAGQIVLYVGQGAGSAAGTAQTGTATYSFYRTAPNTGISIYANSSSSAGTVDNVLYAKVLTPSASGVTITSTKGGATYNWSAKNSAFNYNDTSGYTYEIVKVNAVTELDSDSVLNADATIVMTAGSASWAAAGIDDSAYQDGRHIVRVSDEAGVVAFGYYQSAGAGAIVSTKGGATQNWTNIGTGFSTAGNFTRKILFAGD